MEKLKKYEKNLLHSQKKKWRPHDKNALSWSFICVNDNGKVIFDAFKIMHYMSHAWKKLNNKIFKPHEWKQA